MIIYGVKGLKENRTKFPFSIFIRVGSGFDVSRQKVQVHTVQNTYSLLFFYIGIEISVQCLFVLRGSLTYFFSTTLSEKKNPPFCNFLLPW